MANLVRWRSGAAKCAKIEKNVPIFPGVSAKRPSLIGRSGPIAQAGKTIAWHTPDGYIRGWQ
jgi:hypothetical protein